MEKILLDNFADLTGWATVASGQAQIKISADQGIETQAMRLDFDFRGGGGFVVARKLFSFELPETYAFHFNIRGSAPPNKLEFKLIDPTGQNVWRYQQDPFDFAPRLACPQSRQQSNRFRLGTRGRWPRAAGRCDRVCDCRRSGRRRLHLDRRFMLGRPQFSHPAQDSSIKRTCGT